MSAYPKSVDQLIEHLSKIPSVGPKSAERIAHYVLKAQAFEIKNLADCLLAVKQNIRNCSRCFNLAEQDLCTICQDSKRNPKLICVVEYSKDIVSIEKSTFEGCYHVLMGKLSPISGVGPDQLRINELLHRVKSEQIQEVLLATSADMEGEATAMYIAENLKPLGVKVSRIAYGIPVGSSLDYADQMTLSRAISGRREF